jgi:hypothetical protein
VEHGRGLDRTVNPQDWLVITNQTKYFQMNKVIGFLLLLMIGSFAHAQESNWRVVAGAGMANGGEVISSGIIVVRGTTHEIPFEIKAGNDPQYRIGLEYNLIGGVSVQGTIGYSITDPMGDNGSLEFTTVPVELMAYTSIVGGLRIGAGLRKTKAEITGSGVAANWPELGTYSSSVGKVLEFQYLFSASESLKSFGRTQAGFSARLVNEDFTHNGTTFNGNHYELGLIVYF